MIDLAIDTLPRLLGFMYGFALGVVLMQKYGHSIRCAWCYRPFAFWNRAGDRCCRQHRKIIDDEISRLVRASKRRPNPAARA